MSAAFGLVRCRWSAEAQKRLLQPVWLQEHLSVRLLSASVWGSFSKKPNLSYGT
jgi:hypothetical protein